MHTVTVDKVLNKMVVTLSGKLKDSEISTLEQKIFDGIAELKPQFTVITNLSNYKAREEFPTLVLQKIMHYLKKCGMGQVIRVVGGSKEGLIQFAQNSKGVEEYNVSYVATMSDAMKILRDLH